MSSRAILLLLVSCCVVSFAIFADADDESVALNVSFDNPQMAVTFWQLAVEKEPGSYEAWNNLGQAYAALGQYEKTIECSNKAKKINADRPEAYSNLGMAYNALKRYTEAIAPIKKAIVMNPDLPQAHHNLGYSYMGLGQFREAVPHLQEAARLDKNYTDAYLNLGYAHQQVGEYEQARKYYEKTRELYRKAGNTQGVQEINRILGE